MAEKRTVRIEIQVTPEESAEMLAAAKVVGLPLATYIRVAVLRDVRQ